MNGATMKSRLLTLSIIAAALLGIAAGATHTAAQTANTPVLSALTLSVPADLPPYTSSSSTGTAVFYDTDTPSDPSDDVVPSDPAATVSCDWPSRSDFPRGATLVTCTATLGDERAEGSFYVLVGYGDDIDIEAMITQTPDAASPAGEVTYIFSALNAYGPVNAREVLFESTLPPQVTLLQYDTGRCQYNDTERLLTCRQTEVGIGSINRKSVEIKVQVKEGVSGNFPISVTVSLGQGQRDLKELGNTASRMTQIREISFGPNALFLPLIKK